MKHLKNLTDWLAESRAQQLIALGLAEPDDFFRVDYELSTGYLTRSWERFRNGYHTLPAYYGSPAQDNPAFPPAQWWAVPKSYKSEDFAGSRVDVSWPDGLSTEALRLQALSLDLVEFLDWVDSQVMDHIVKTRRTPADWTQGTIVVRSVRTGKMEEIDEAKELNESGFDRLFGLGLVDPGRSNRIEYLTNRAVLVDAHERIEAGQVPAKEMGFPFFFVYCYDEAGTPTNSQAGTDVLGREFLTGSDLSELIGLDFEAFLNRVETLFTKWLKAQPDEYFRKRLGFKSRPLFARDETAAILGFTDWTPLRESGNNFSKLLRLGLIDPLSQPRVQYEVSGWFMDYMTNLIPGVSSSRLWKDDIKAAIIGRVKIYEPGNEDIARWVSLVGLDLFDGPDDIDQIREQELDRDGLRELAAERILGVIKRGFSNNWRTSSSPDPDAEDPGPPTLIKRADQGEWRPFSLNESKDEDIMKLFKLGLIDSPAYLAYEINEERLANRQSEFMDPRANEPAFRKHLIYNVLAESFAWWEHRLPEEAGKADPNLRLSSVIDGEYWLDEGSIQLRMLMRDGDELDFDVPFEEFLQEIKHRIVEYLRGDRAPFDRNYKPLYVLDKETGVRYSVKTGEPM